MGIASPSRTLVGVTAFIPLLVISLAAAGGLAWVRISTKRQRVEASARLKAEMEQFTVASPTERLFLEAGVPVTEEMRVGLVQTVPAAGARTEGDIETPMPSSVTGETVREMRTEMPPITSDLADLCAGIDLPGGLIPESMEPGPGVECALASFTTSEVGLAEMATLLTTEFTRIGSRIDWTSDSTARLKRGEDQASLELAAGELDSGIEQVTLRLIAR